MAAVISCKGYGHLIVRRTTVQAESSADVLGDLLRGLRYVPPLSCWKAGWFPPLSAGKMATGVQRSPGFPQRLRVYYATTQKWLMSTAGTHSHPALVNDVQCILFNEAEHTGIHFITVP